MYQAAQIFGFEGVVDGGEIEGQQVADAPEGVLLTAQHISTLQMLWVERTLIYGEITITIHQCDCNIRT